MSKLKIKKSTVARKDNEEVALSAHISKLVKITDVTKVITTGSAKFFINTLKFLRKSSNITIAITIKEAVNFIFIAAKINNPNNICHITFLIFLFSSLDNK